MSDGMRYCTVTDSCCRVRLGVTSNVQAAMWQTSFWMANPTTPDPYGNVVEVAAEDGIVEFRCNRSYSLQQLPGVILEARHRLGPARDCWRPDRLGT